MGETDLTHFLCVCAAQLSFEQIAQLKVVKEPRSQTHFLYWPFISKRRWAFSDSCSCWVPWTVWFHRYRPREAYFQCTLFRLARSIYWVKSKSISKEGQWHTFLPVHSEMIGMIRVYREVQPTAVLKIHSSKHPKRHYNASAFSHHKKTTV